MDEIEHTYDGKFEGNILLVGRTASGKTIFVQNLGKKNLFGDISEVYWISKITLSEERKSAIRDQELVIKNCILSIQRTWKILII